MVSTFFTIIIPSVLGVLIYFKLFNNSDKYYNEPSDEIFYNEKLKYAIKVPIDPPGPESFAFDGSQLFTGINNGLYTINVKNGTFRKIIDIKKCLVYNEELCGRILGVQYHSVTKKLYLIDSIHGIYSYEPAINLVETILDRQTMNISSIKFLNSIQIDNNGVIYFTSSSSKYERKNFLLAALEANNDGRVFAYDTMTKNLTTIMSGLRFPNGILLDDKKHKLYIAELCRARIIQYDITNSKTSIFAPNLPTYPDNLKWSPRGSIWTAGVVLRDEKSFIDMLAPYPAIRKLMSLLVKYGIYIPKLEKFGIVVEIDGQTGKVIRTLQDPDGTHVYHLSEAFEIDGKLYLGSFSTPFYSILDLNQTDN